MSAAADGVVKGVRGAELAADCALWRLCELEHKDLPLAKRRCPEGSVARCGAVLEHQAMLGCACTILLCSGDEAWKSRS
jgi:hypothetical protein